MAPKYPGLYLYFDWLKGLERMPPEIAMKIICNLYHFAQEGREPEPMEEIQFHIVQDVYLDQLKRNLKRSATCSSNAGKRYQRTTPTQGFEHMTEAEMRDYMKGDAEYDQGEIEEILALQRSLRKNRG